MHSKNPAVDRMADRTAWQHFFGGGSGPLFWENRCPQGVGDGTVW